MKLRLMFLVELILLAAGLASAQLPHTFTHVVVVFQENRTPDNIFGSGAPNFLNGQADIHGAGESGVCKRDSNNPPLAQNNKGLVTCYDLGHSHSDWSNMCDPAGSTCNMDNACRVGVDTKDGGPGCTAPSYPQYQYLPATVAGPYISIAQEYGFGNYMFQTNEGPSFPAHQFILTGTSAPVAPGHTYDNYFAAENPKGGGLQYPGDNTGCPAPQGEYVEWIDPSGAENMSSAPCYQHPSLTDQLALYFPSGAAPSWKYYAPYEGSLWTAPNAIQSLCYIHNVSPEPCDGPAWNSGSSMVLETVASTSMAPILSDISGCQLANVSWVVPDGRWSDHAGPSGPRNGNIGLGPAYVAAIVNAIGSDTTCEKGAGYWSDTVILITWDDWGGWYDHVAPIKVINDGTSWGSGYVYGFRVPLLVVSAWTPAGYVDGACSGGSCQNNKFPYQHDFGSILAFIEADFRLQLIAGSGQYADANAPDLGAQLGPLGTFFQASQFRQFQSIPLVSPYTGMDANYFTTYSDGSGPADPDNDASTNDD